MKLESEHEIAVRALAALRQLRLADRNTAIKELLLLAHDVANRRVEEHARADAWLAVCRLGKTLEDDPKADTGRLWDDAIAKTDAWRAAS
jgi:hypothetical protein